MSPLDIAIHCRLRRFQNPVNDNMTLRRDFDDTVRIHCHQAVELPQETQPKTYPAPGLTHGGLDSHFRAQGDCLVTRVLHGDVQRRDVVMPSFTGFPKPRKRVLSFKHGDTRCMDGMVAVYGVLIPPSNPRKRDPAAESYIGCHLYTNHR